MKKITLLVAAALVSAGLSAQTVQKYAGYFDPDTVLNLFWNATAATWVGENDVLSLEADVMPEGFTEGNIALFNDEAGWLFSDAAIMGEFQLSATTKPNILVSSMSVGGIIVNSSTLTYNFSPANETAVLTAPEGNTTATLTKKGSSTFYTDVANELPGGIIIEEGTVARKSGSSIAQAVFGKKVAVAAGAEGTVDLRSSGSDYALLLADLEVPAGSTLNLITSRYSGMSDGTNPVSFSGEGTLNIYFRGDRSFMGGQSKAKAGVDFSDFHGDLNILKAEDAGDAGWYGPIFPAQTPKGTGFARDIMAFHINNIENDSLPYNLWLNDRVLLDSAFYDLSDANVYVGPGANICGESMGSPNNVLPILMKNLNVHKEGKLAGYYKDSNPQIMYRFGSDNKDSHIDGTITAYTKGGKPYNEDGAGLIKEGTGTAYITAPDNQIFLGVDVWEGRVLFNNPNPEFTSATGSHKAKTNNTVICRKDGIIGGFGSIGGHTAVYGKVQPGSDAIGTLRIDGTYAIVEYDATSKGIYSEATGTAVAARTEGTKNARLQMYAGSSMEFEIINKDKHDHIYVQGDTRLFPDTVAGKVELKLSPRDNWSVEAGDEFVLIDCDSMYTYIDGTTLEESFTLVVDDAFAAANFSLKTELTPAVIKTEEIFNEETLETEIKTTVVSPAQAKLIAVAGAAASGSAEADAIESVTTEKEAISVEYISISGVVTTAPVQGFNFRRTTYADGSVTVEKILVK